MLHRRSVDCAAMTSRVRSGVRVARPLRSVLRFEPARDRSGGPPPPQVGERGRHAPDHPTAGAPRGVRLRRRWCRGRAHAPGELRRLRSHHVPAPHPARRRTTIDPSTTLLGRPLPLPMVLLPHRLHPDPLPGGRARGGAAPLTGPGSRTRCRRSAPARSRRSRPSARARSGSRCTCGATGASCRSWSTGPGSPGYEALVLTVDNAVFGRRERDHRRGFTLPPTDRTGHASSTAHSIRSGRGGSCGPSPSASPTSPAARWATAAEAVSLHRVHRHPVRPHDVVARPRVAPRPLERAARGEGDPDGRRRGARGPGRRAGGDAVEPRRPSARRRTHPDLARRAGDRCRG